MDADQFLAGNAEHPEGVGIPQVRLGGIWYVLYIREGFDLVGRHPRGGEAVVIKPDRPVTVIDQGFQPFELERLEFFPADAFHPRIPNLVCHLRTPFSHNRTAVPIQQPDRPPCGGALSHFTPIRDNCKEARVHFEKISRIREGARLLTRASCPGK